MKRVIIIGLVAGAMAAQAQKFEVVTSTDGNYFQQSKASLSGSPKGKLVEAVTDAPEFQHWGMTFNELDRDALQMLSAEAQAEVTANIFAPDGQLRMSMGRISPGANDYARSWYSCDEVPGDFELRYFNIDRDKEAIIPFIHLAQTYCPEMEFWISPWSPPSWMKINHDYPVLSSEYNRQDPRQDYMLYGNDGRDVDPDEMKLTGPRDGQFPKRLATTDYFIQDPRYLSAYAQYFCRFIDAYQAEGIPVKRVMYQNEAYSYTPYPGCAWTAPSIIRFNRDYLAPALRASHPEVELWLGTFNTNRLDHVEQLTADAGLMQAVSGMGFQWEGRDILPTIRQANPEIGYMCSESECGWGSFDWAGAEHTFELINHYLGNGCNRYNFWNVILTDSGESPWGWKQNALIRVDSATGQHTYTPEYYAVRHYAQYEPQGSRVVGRLAGNVPVTSFDTPNGRVVVAANLTDEKTQVSVPIGKRYLNLTLAPHSFLTASQRP
ncbi:MAG: beta-glycosidase [Bacteroidales bacterium]|nr:beta-glycosidase [Bacteroidales bacterium]